jgi:hypothetical protein
VANLAYFPEEAGSSQKWKKLRQKRRVRARGLAGVVVVWLRREKKEAWQGPILEPTTTKNQHIQTLHHTQSSSFLFLPTPQLAATALNIFVGSTNNRHTQKSIR